MADTPSPKLTMKTPVSIWNKPVKVDAKDLFKALAKTLGNAVSQKWVEAGASAVEALCALGLETDAGELAFRLVQRAVVAATFDLVGESGSDLLTSATTDEDAANRLNYEITYRGIDIDGKFLDRPADLPFVADHQALLEQWLASHGVPTAKATSVARRFPEFFVYALNQEWRRNAKSYAPIVAAISTPFTNAGEREWAWSEYAAALKRRVQESVFDEPFGLEQIFVPLNAYIFVDPATKSSLGTARGDQDRRRTVVRLQEELDAWLEEGSRTHVIRVISGGPGSGKSSFAKIFAARVALAKKWKPLYIPLHRIDPDKDLTGEVGMFARSEGLTSNPLDIDSLEPNLLIIFDGLDELSSQGKAAAETARNFVREVEKTVSNRNQQSLKIRVLLCGRELVVQENETEFRGSRKILNLLPYFVSNKNNEFDDDAKILDADLRDVWWKTYGTLSGQNFQAMPKELRGEDLDEVTAQPLLNYLVALSYKRQKLNFSAEINLNHIYGDLIGAVYERGYEEQRHPSIKHMSQEEFERVLQEIGLAIWHGDGRSTTIREIKEHCEASGASRLLDSFREGAEAGVTTLLAAFFFRRYGQRDDGDKTFVFTHKSFGEYLAARRIVVQMENTDWALTERSQKIDRGWDERQSLEQWARVCGPSAISKYTHRFLVNEVILREPGEAARWQGHLSTLFSYMLRYGMPMEQLKLNSFKEQMFQSRNAEEALLVAVNACARRTEKIIQIEWPQRESFGEWFKRVQGQRTGEDSVLAARCLSFFGLSRAVLHFVDFFGADLSGSDLSGVESIGAFYADAELNHVNLRDADLTRACFTGSRMTGAVLKSADLTSSDLRNTDLTSADLEGVDLDYAITDENTKLPPGIEIPSRAQTAAVKAPEP